MAIKVGPIDGRSNVTPILIRGKVDNAATTVEWKNLEFSVLEGVNGGAQIIEQTYRSGRESVGRS